MAGCDLLTISPKLLAELESSEDDVPEYLDAKKAKDLELEKLDMDEKAFRWMMNEDQMATDKLSEGIRKFAQDQNKMDAMVRKLLQGWETHSWRKKTAHTYHHDFWIFYICRGIILSHHVSVSNPMFSDLLRGINYDIIISNACVFYDI